MSKGFTLGFLISGVTAVFGRFGGGVLSQSLKSRNASIALFGGRLGSVGFGGAGGGGGWSRSGGAGLAIDRENSSASTAVQAPLEGTHHG